MKKRRTVVVFCVVGVLLLILVARRRLQLRQAAAFGMRPLPVRVATAERKTIEAGHDYLAVVEAWKTARISSRMAARVINVPLDEGDTVEAGDLLVQLDDQDLQAELKAVAAQQQAVDLTIVSLQTNLEYWTRESDRDRALAQKGVIPPSAAEATANRAAAAQAKLDAARANADSLKHRQDSIRAKLKYTRITSPFAGLITRRDVDPGDLASPGKSLMVLEDRSRLKLAFDAPQEDAVFLREGLPVRAHAGDRTLDLKVTHIYPSLDKSRMVRVEAELLGKSGLPIGAYVPVSVVLTRREHAVVVPAESLIEMPGGKTAIFVVKSDESLEARPVRRLFESAGMVEVEGVSPGERVVTSTFLGWATLSSGVRVEVVE